MEWDNDWMCMPTPRWSEVKMLHEQIAKLQNRVNLLEEGANPTQYWLKKTLENPNMPAAVKRTCRQCSVSHDSFVPMLPDFSIYEDRENPRAVALLNVLKNPFIPVIVKFTAKHMLDEEYPGYISQMEGNPDVNQDEDIHNEDDDDDDDNEESSDEEANGLARILHRCRERGTTVNYIEENYLHGPLGYLSNGWSYGEGDNGEIIPLNYKLARAALMGEPGSLEKYSRWKAHAMRRVLTLEVRE